MRKFAHPAAALVAVLFVSTQAQAWRGDGVRSFHGGFGGFRHFEGSHHGFNPGLGFRDRFGFRREFFAFGFAPGWPYVAGYPYFYYPYYPY
jgi:hypothetical protein